MLTRPSREIAPWTRADLAACAGCAALGLALAVAPHLARWVATGSPVYLADGDDILYLAISRIPYQGGWSLRDPFCTPDRNVPTLYAWLQFVPLAKLARALGLPSVLTGLLWRAVGGPALGAALFILFRKLLGGTRRPTAWALGAALICLADPAFIAGRPLIRDFVLLLEMVRSTGPLIAGNRMPQYRVVTPLLNLPWLLLLVAALVPGGRRGWRAWAAGAICLGACFHLYFFYWTAAIVGIGAYLAVRAVAVWRGRPATGGEGIRELGFGVAVLVGGAALGASQVYGNARTFADPAYRPTLHRMQKGAVLPPGDPRRSEQLWNVWPLAELAVVGAAIVGLGLRNLGLPWFMILAGYLLNNHAIVTGLDFENNHWAYVYSPFGEIALLALGALVLDGLGPSRWKSALWALPAVLVAIALAWRPYDALRHRFPVQSAQLWRELEPLAAALGDLGPDETLAGPGESNLALLMTRAGHLYDYDHTWDSSPVPTAEVGQRFALDAWLMGMDMPRFLEASAERQPVVRDGMRAAWTGDFQAVLDGGAAPLLERFRVGALLLPSSAPEPTRGGPWRRAASGEAWTLWRRDPR